MSDPRFLQDDPNKRLSHAIEEAGEFIAAAGKMQRWGPDSVNPLLPPEQQEKNIDWVLRECADLRQALARFEQSWLPASTKRSPGREAIAAVIDPDIMSDERCDSLGIANVHRSALRDKVRLKASVILALFDR